MRAALASLFLGLCCRGVFSQRVANPILEVDFLREICIDDTVDFPTIGQLGAGQNNFEMTSMGTGVTIECPTIIFEDEVFTDASNGFTSTSDGALISSLQLDQNAFVDSVPDHSFEFFFFVDPLQESGRFTFVEIGRNAFNEVPLNAWVAGDDYFFRIGLEVTDVNGAATIFVELGNEIDDDVDITLNPSIKLHHVIVTVTRDFQNNRATFTYFVNGEEIDDNTNNGNPTLDFSAGQGEAFLTLGMSFAALLGANNVDKQVTMPYDMHKFAIYDKALVVAEASGNFEFKTVNSLPAARPVALDHIEDDSTTFTFDDLVAVFDFDNAFIPGRTDNIQINIVTKVDAEIGVIAPNRNVVATDELLQFTQTEENRDDLEGTLVFFAFQNGNTGEKSLDNDILTIAFKESNDPPEAQDNAGFQVAELQVGLVELLATDSLDFGEGKNESFFPQKFIITDIQVDTIDNVPVATFISCEVDGNGDDVPIAAGDEFLAVEGEDGQFLGTICIRANAFDDRVDAKLGDAAISYTVEDLESSLNNPVAALREGTASVEVLQALFSGCQFLNAEDCEEFFSESEIGDLQTFTLQFFDSRCDEAVVNINNAPPFVRDDACDERDANREAVIVGPLPDPVLEGSLFFVDGGVDIEITEELLAENEGEIVLPAESNFQIKFRAVPEYFNLSPFPLCNRDQGERVLDQDLFPNRGDCVDFDNARDRLDCFGIFCEDGAAGGQFGGKFSSAIEVGGERVPYGSCSVEIDEGCPVKIFTRLRIGLGSSPLEADTPPGHILWVRNDISADPRYDVNPQQTEFDLTLGNGKKLDPPISIEDEEPNARIALIAFAIDRSGSVTIPGSLDFDDNGDDRFTILDVDPNLNTGIAADSPLGDDDNNFIGRLVGPSPIINDELVNLEIGLDEDGTRLTVTLQHPFRLGSLQQTRDTRFTLNAIEAEPEATDVTDILLQPEIIGISAFVCCCCCFLCYKCFENDTCKCIFVGQKFVLVASKTAEGVGIKKRRVRGRLEDEDPEKGKHSKRKKGSSDRQRGKAKQNIARSHRADSDDVTSRRARGQDSDRKKKGHKKNPPQSYRKKPQSSRSNGSSDSEEDSSRRKPKRKGVYNNGKGVRPPPRSHRKDS